MTDETTTEVLEGEIIEPQYQISLGVTPSELLALTALLGRVKAGPLFELYQALHAEGLAYDNPYGVSFDPRGYLEVGLVA